MPESYRGYAWENIDYTSAPVGGWNTDTVAWEIPGNQAPVLDNFIVRPGNLKARGQLWKFFSDLNSIANVYNGVQGAFSLLPIGGGFLSGYVATPGAAPWDVVPMLAKSNLISARTTGYQFSTSSPFSSGAITYPTAGTVPGPRWINVDGTIFYLGFGAASTASDPASSYTIQANGLFYMPSTVGMQIQSQTVNLPKTGTLTDGGGTGAVWTTTGGVGTISLGTTSPSNTSNVLNITNLGFTIPSAAIIKSFELTLEVNDSGTSGGSQVKDVHISIEGTSMPIGTKNITGFYEPQNRYSVYGGPGDPWGTATGAYASVAATTNVNATNFGFGVQIQNIGSGPGSVTLTPLSVTVYYGVAAGVATTGGTVSGGAPTGSVDLTSYLNRIWMAGGTTPGGASTTHSSTTIYWTNPTTIAGLAHTVADWTNTSTGLINQIRLDNNTGDPIMGFGTLQNQLLILRRQSVYALRGTTESNFSIVKVTNTTGCLDPRSIQVVDNICYFVGPNGLMATDGSTVKNVSGSVQYSMMNAIQAEQESVFDYIQGNTGFISSGLTSTGQYYLNIGTQTWSTTQKDGTNTAGSYSMTTLWSGLYDPQIQAWTRITSRLWSSQNSAPGVTASPNIPGMAGLMMNSTIGGSRGLYTQTNDGITILENSLYNISLINGSDLYDMANQNTVAAADTYAYPLPQDGNNALQYNYLGIPYRWVTKFVNVVGTSSLNRKYAQPTRFFLDHQFAGNSLWLGRYISGTLTTNVQQSDGWTGRPLRIDQFTTPIDTSVAVHSSIDATTSFNLPTGGSVYSPFIQDVASRMIQRENADFGYEVSDLLYEVIWDGDSGQVLSGKPTASQLPVQTLSAEIYGVGTEYQPTRNIRTKN